MSRNGVACSTPFRITRILPACSTTKIRPSLSGCVRKTGLVSPVVMKGFSLRVRPGGKASPPSPGPVDSHPSTMTPSRTPIIHKDRPSTDSRRRNPAIVYFWARKNTTRIRATHMPRNVHKERPTAISSRSPTFRRRRSTGCSRSPNRCARASTRRSRSPGNRWR